MKTAIVLAGGLGTRLHAVTKDLYPKCMVWVQDRPFLEYILFKLELYKYKKIILAVSHHAEIIQNHFGNQFGSLKLEYSIESKPLGTGGAILQALSLVKNETVTVINGDTFFDVDLYALNYFHQNNQSQITIALKELKEFDRYGTVTINISNRIQTFHEKKYCSLGYINGGIYILNKSIFSNQSTASVFSFEQNILTANISSLKMYGFPSDGLFIDIGIPEDYEKAKSLNFL